ncbi:unnamed protein product, partial [Rotaria socialis]
MDLFAILNSTVESELVTTSVTNRTKMRITKEYDVIIIGAAFTDLIAVHELSCRGQRSTRPEFERLQESECGSFFAVDSFFQLVK